MENIFFGWKIFFGSGGSASIPDPSLRTHTPFCSLVRAMPVSEECIAHMVRCRMASWRDSKAAFLLHKTTYHFGPVQQPLSHETAWEGLDAKGMPLEVLKRVIDFVRGKDWEYRKFVDATRMQFEDKKYRIAYATAIAYRDQMEEQIRRGRIQLAVDHVYARMHVAYEFKAMYTASRQGDGLLDTEIYCDSDSEDSF